LVFPSLDTKMGTLSTISFLLTLLQPPPPLIYHSIYITRYGFIFIVSFTIVFLIFIALQGLETNIIFDVVKLIIVLSVQHYMAGKKYLWFILCRTLYFWFGLWCLTPHSTIYYRYIVVVSFIGGGNGLPGENHRPVASHGQTLSHNAFSSTHRQEGGSKLQL
jgi:hypothetical protein